MIRKGLFAFASWLLLSCVVLPLSAEELRIVAVVNDEVITQTELDRALAPVYMQLQASYGPEELAAKVKEMKEQVLQHLIEERLILQEARSPRPVEVSKGKIGTPQPITVTGEEVDEIVQEMTAKFEGPQEFKEALNEQGLTLDDLKARYRDQVTIRKLVDREVRSRVVISPSEITAYYNSHGKEFEKPPAVQVAAILIKPKETLDRDQAQKLAQTLTEQIKQGADFYDLARRYSDGPNAQMGGRIGFMEQGKSLKQIDEILFTLKAGEVSPVVPSPVGFYIFRVESIEPGRQVELEEARTQIRDKLLQEKGSIRYREWIDKLKSDAYISIK